MTVQMISSRVFPWICGPSASSRRRAAAAEADDEEDERRLDGDEDDGADGEDEPVELVDRLAVRRSRGSPAQKPPFDGSCPNAAGDDAEGERHERSGDDGGRRPPHGPLRFYSARREPGFATNVTRSGELKFTRYVVQ